MWLLVLNYICQKGIIYMGHGIEMVAVHIVIGLTLIFRLMNHWLHVSHNVHVHI